MYETFDKQLEVGLLAEHELARLLIAKHPHIKIKFNNISKDYKQLRKYDFEIFNNGTVTQIEVKHDLKAPFTGNVAVEIDCVIKSTAEWFCYKIDKTFYYVSRYQLYEFIRNKQGRFTWACENGKNYILLVKMNDFLKHAIQVN
jgi:hypothetical protein